MRECAIGADELLACNFNFRHAKHGRSEDTFAKVCQADRSLQQELHTGNDGLDYAGNEQDMN